MQLPVMPPVLPMLAKSVKALPDPATFWHDEHPGLLFEPKWDGFRCLVFKDGDEVELASRNTKPLTRYFPEVVANLRTSLADRCVLDGELIVAVGDRLEFDRLQERIHPADSRVRMLAETTPAAYVAFDVLAIGDEDLMRTPLAVRRDRLVALLGGGPAAGLHLTRATTETDLARAWFEQFEGAGLDGVVAKPLSSTYQPDVRAMFKVKHDRTADVVVAGYRLHKNSTDDHPLLGSLLLGLYDDEDNLRHIGVSASFTAARRAQLVEELQPLVCPAEEHPWGAWSEITASGERVPGGGSRWNAGKDLSFVPLRPERVLEVGYDHMEGERFRHTAQFKRWRSDRDPRSCRYDQLEEPVGYDLADVLGGVQGRD